MATVADIKAPIAVIRPVPSSFQKSRRIPLGSIAISEDVNVDNSNLQYDKLFIRLLNNLMIDYRCVKNRAINHEVKSIFEQSASFLLELEPNKISVEFTNDDSIVFTFIKQDETIFFERYLDNTEEEVIFSHYVKEEKQPSFSGTFEDAKTILLDKGISKGKVLFMAC